jgi:hypothetical protein
MHTLKHACQWHTNPTVHVSSSYDYVCVLTLYIHSEPNVECLSYAALYQHYHTSRLLILLYGCLHTIFVYYYMGVLTLFFCFSEPNVECRSNAAFLLGAYLIARLGVCM